MLVALAARRRASPQTRRLLLLQHCAARTRAQLRLSTLAVLEQKGGRLNPSSLCAISAAQKLGGPVHAFVAGANVKGVTQEAARVNGVDKILAVENAVYERVSLASYPQPRYILKQA